MNDERNDTGGAMTPDPVEVTEVLVLEDAPDPDLVLPVWEPTGVPAVDSALDRLRLVTEGGLDTHPDVFGSIHSDLRQVLGDLDTDKT